MKTLTHILNTEGSDKGTIGPSEGHPGHNYADIYEAYFGHRRLEPLKILEVGIGLKHKEDARIAHGRNVAGGASIKAWHAYFPHAAIHAIDMVEARWLDNERITTYVVDQSSPASLESFLTTTRGILFDIIIDDGSHHPDHQQLTLGMLFPRVAPGGIYAIEDLQRNGYGDLIKGVRCTNRALNTRSVLKGYLEGGTFNTPHVIPHADELAQGIQHLAFHTPTQRIIPLGIVKRILGMSGRMVMYQEDTELLAVLRKK